MFHGTAELAGNFRYIWATHLHSLHACIVINLVNDHLPFIHFVFSIECACQWTNSLCSVVCGSGFIADILIAETFTMTGDTSTEQSTDVDDVLNMAMANHLASGENDTQSAVTSTSPKNGERCWEVPHVEKNSWLWNSCNRVNRLEKCNWNPTIQFWWKRPNVPQKEEENIKKFRLNYL